MRFTPSAALLVLLLAPHGLQAQTARPTAAVYVENRNDALSNVAQQLGDSLTGSLINVGSFALVDRAHIAAVLREQRLATEGQVTPATEAQIGKMLGVNYLFVVKVDAYKGNIEQRVSGLSLLTKQSYYVAHVNLIDRVEIIEVNSGLILQSIDDNEQGDSGLLQGSTARSDAETFMSQERDKLIAASADVVSKKIDSSKFGAPAQKPQVAGKILSIDDGQIILSLTEADGVTVGEMLSFYDTRSVLNPDTGKTITTLLKRGTIQILQVEKDYCVGKAVDGSPVKLQVVKPQ